jgi:effector-binding domain-containing protein
MRFVALLALLFAVVACQETPKKPEKRPLPIKTVEFPSRTVLVLPRRGPYGRIDRAIEELIVWMEKRKVVPAGPFMGVFYDNPTEVPEDRTRYEVQVPVIGAPEAEAPVEVKVTKRMTTAAVVLAGPYDRIAKRYPEIYAWIDRNGYEIVGPLIEVYTVPPGPDVAPADLRTEVHVPVRPAKP